jgi:hypothetical protein
VTQAQWQMLASKVTVLAAIVTLTSWVIVYTNLANWWTDHVGRTFAFKTIILIFLLVLTVPEMFWTLTRDEIVGLTWVQIALVALISPVMVWRIVVFLHERGDATWLRQWARRRREK